MPAYQRLLFGSAAAALVLLLLAGCSAKQAAAVGHRLKTASCNAVTDPVTWVPFAGAMALYATDSDARLTDYYVKHHWTGLYRSHTDDLVRGLNGAITIGTAAAVPEKRWQRRAERVALEVGTTQVVILASDGLKNHINKESPDGKSRDAIGSFHATIPFANSAMTRRNVALAELPLWADYGLVGASYVSSVFSALVRVEEGGHSFADQMVNASVGNFIGLFMHDLFLLKDDLTVQTEITPERTGFTITYRY